MTKPVAKHARGRESTESVAARFEQAHACANVALRQPTKGVESRSEGRVSRL